MNGKIMLNGKAYSSSGRPSKEITYAQWLALPDTKYTDGIVYYIKDIGGANQFPPLIYSDEEREVGVWKDGRPLYQRTWEFSGYIDPGTKSWNNVLDVSSLNISKLVICDVMDQEGCYHTGYLTRIQNGYLQVYDFEAWPFKYITLQYTKTTDTPGSGTWTTDGTYAHHYSTSEKVIGTWLDGKPIYECSWEFSPMLSVPPVSWTNTSITVASKNFKKIVGCEAVSGDGDIWGCISAGCTNGATTYVQLMSSRQQYNVSIEKLTLRYTKTTD